MKIATSRYQAKDLVQASGLVPLGHTVGAPRFISYELAGNVGLLAPYGFHKAPISEEEFTARYRARLDALGVEKIRAVLQAFTDAFGAPGVVLLCFDDVLGGEFCHRTVFADWWEEHTGEQVPELGA